MKTTQIQTKKNQKPIDFDVHLKYLCQNCGQIHWLSFQESSTKNFKVVCGCGNVFKVKRTHKFQIKYYKSDKSPSNTESEISFDEPISILENYGFTKTEASELITSAYNRSNIRDSLSLVKEALSSLRK